MESKDLNTHTSKNVTCCDSEELSSAVQVHSPHNSPFNWKWPDLHPVWSFSGHILCWLLIKQINIFANLTKVNSFTTPHTWGAYSTQLNSPLRRICRRVSAVTIPNRDATTCAISFRSTIWLRSREEDCNRGVYSVVEVRPGWEVPTRHSIQLTATETTR